MDKEFNKDNEYGNFVEIVPPGCSPAWDSSFAVIYGVEWNDMSVAFAIELCRENLKKFIPEEYRYRANIIKKPPGNIGSPLETSGSVGWKYSSVEIEVVNA